MKKLLIALLSALMLAFGCMAFAACEDGTVGTGGGNGTGEGGAGEGGAGNGGSEGEQTVEVTSVTLDRTSLTLAEGDEMLLTATVLPADATQKTVTWTSSAPAIATVADGLVTALAAGEATVTAACGSVQASCTVTITPYVSPEKAPVTAEEWAAAFDFLDRPHYAIDADEATYMPGETPEFYDYFDYATADGCERVRVEGGADAYAYAEKTDDGYIHYYNYSFDNMYSIVKSSVPLRGLDENEFAAEFLWLLSAMKDRYAAFSDRYDEESRSYSGEITDGEDAFPVEVAFAGGALVRLAVSYEIFYGTGGEQMDPADGNDASGSVPDEPQSPQLAGYNTVVYNITYRKQHITVPSWTEPEAIKGEETEITAASFDVSEVENMAVRVTGAAFSGDTMTGILRTMSYVRADEKEYVLMGEEEIYSARVGKEWYGYVCNQNVWEAERLTEEYPASALFDLPFNAEEMSAAVYDAENGCYVLSDNANSCRAWFREGRLLRFLMDIDYGYTRVLVCYDYTYGGQSITLPDFSPELPITSEEWEELFSVLDGSRLNVTTYIPVEGTDVLYTQYMRDGRWEYSKHSEEIEGPTSSATTPRYVYDNDDGTYTVIYEEGEGMYSIDDTLDAPLSEQQEILPLLNIIASSYTDGAYVFDAQRISYVSRTPIAWQDMNFTVGVSFTSYDVIVSLESADGAITMYVEINTAARIYDTEELERMMWIGTQQWQEAFTFAPTGDFYMSADLDYYSAGTTAEDIENDYADPEYVISSAVEYSAMDGREDLMLKTLDDNRTYYSVEEDGARKVYQRTDASDYVVVEGGSALFELLPYADILAELCSGSPSVRYDRWQSSFYFNITLKGADVTVKLFTTNSAAYQLTITVPGTSAGEGTTVYQVDFRHGVYASSRVDDAGWEQALNASMLQNFYVTCDLWSRSETAVTSLNITYSIADGREQVFYEGDSEWSVFENGSYTVYTKDSTTDAVVSSTSTTSLMEKYDLAIDEMFTLLSSQFASFTYNKGQRGYEGVINGIRYMIAFDEGEVDRIEMTAYDENTESEVRNSYTFEFGGMNIDIPSANA